MSELYDDLRTTFITSYHDVLQFEETKRKYSRTTTSFRGRNAMEWIYNEGGKKCSEIADYLRITRPSASSLIRKLEDLDYVYRSTSDGDGRCEMINLTRKGRLVTAYQTHHRDAMLSAVIDEFTEDELKIILKGFKKMNEVFENCCTVLEESNKER